MVYTCKLCNYEETANNIETIVSRGKLCLSCLTTKADTKKNSGRTSLARTKNPKGKCKKKKGQKSVDVVWECVSCKREHNKKDKPYKCISCGCEKLFRKY